MDTAVGICLIQQVICELSVRALRAHREQQKHTKEHRALQEALQRITSELEEAVDLAGLLYDTNQRMGTVIDYLLKERGTVPTGESQSFEIVLDRVLDQLEGTGGDRTGGIKSPTSAEDVTMAENPTSTGGSPRARRAAMEQAWSRR